MRISKFLLIFLLSGLSLGFAQGALNIRSTPPGAAVFVNDNYIGDAPLLYDVPLGSYRVRLELDGFTPFASQVQVLGDEIINVAGQLLASNRSTMDAPMNASGSMSGSGAGASSRQEVAIERAQNTPQAYGTARIASPFTGAMVIINGNTTGVIPNGGVLTVRRVPVGQHVLRLELSSQQFFEQAFNVAPDQMTNVIADGSGMANIAPNTAPSARMNTNMMNTNMMNPSLQNPRIQPGSALSNPNNVSITSQTLGNVSGIVGAGRMTSLAGPFGGLGDVRIDSNPRAVQVFIDGRYLGITPMNPIPLEPGVHQLRFIAPGLGETLVQVNVVPGETQNVFVDLLQ